MARKIRHYFYEYYWLVGVATLLSLAYFAYIAQSSNLSYYISFGAAVLSGMYFVQKQKLEEDKLFFEAFTNFNSRFAELNPVLLSLPETEEVEQKHKYVIAKYFDLCAEEYYYYKHGRLPHDVWKSWAQGILYYIRNYPCIKKYWVELEESDSSYGMTIASLKKTESEI